MTRHHLGSIKPRTSRLPVASRVGVLVAALTLLIGCATINRSASPPSDTGVAWPGQGQAALDVSTDGRTDAQRSGTSGSAVPVPIASVAKMMTAYLVLRAAPLEAGSDGFTLTVTPDQVADTGNRRRLGQSLVKVAVGERLTERQALEALLLPSANNVAAILALHVAGSADGFVALMNAGARALGMRHTRYTDPSGYDPATVSTAADQLRLVHAAMREPAFAAIVALPSAVVPVAGRVRNTDRLLGKDGFIGVKTGSDDDAGGCFAFVSVHRVDGHTVVVSGVVLGQRHAELISAALAAARRLVDSVLAGPTT